MGRKRENKEPVSFRVNKKIGEQLRKLPHMPHSHVEKFLAELLKIDFSALEEISNIELDADTHLRKAKEYKEKFGYHNTRYNDLKEEAEQVKKSMRKK